MLPLPPLHLWMQVRVWIPGKQLRFCCTSFDYISMSKSILQLFSWCTWSGGTQASVAFSYSNNSTERGNRLQTALSLSYSERIMLTGGTCGHRRCLRPLNCGVSADKGSPVEEKFIFLLNINALVCVISWIELSLCNESVVICPSFLLVIISSRGFPL